MSLPWLKFQFEKENLCILMVNYANDKKFGKDNKFHTKICHTLRFYCNQNMCGFFMWKNLKHACVCV